MRIVLGSIFWPSMIISHRIHGTAIFTYIYHNKKATRFLDAGKYTSAMDPSWVFGGIYAIKILSGFVMNIQQSPRYNA